MGRANDLQHCSTIAPTIKIFRMSNTTNLRLAVGSKNPVKINAAKAGFEQMFAGRSFVAEGFDVPSGVSDQPMSDGETLTGATNRANRVRELSPDADYAIGIEGGIDTIDDTLFAFAWMVVIDSTGRIGRGRSGSFALPPSVKKLVDSGLELGHANDTAFKEHNSKQAGGAVASLTGGAVSRQSLYEHAMVLTLAAFHQPELFFETAEA